MTATWDILICSIASRDALLRELLQTLSDQMCYGVTVRVCRDNMEASYPAKCQALLDSAEGSYVSFIDDDDTVARDFIPEVMGALESMPDYVGFPVLYTVDGVPQLPVEHSLHYGGWNVIDDRPEVLTRDITHFNPIYTKFARLGKWEGQGWQADFRWANQVRATGHVRTQVWISRWMYHKRDVSSGDFRSRPQPAIGGLAALPPYHFLREVTCASGTA